MHIHILKITRFLLPFLLLILEAFVAFHQWRSGFRLVSKTDEEHNNIIIKRKINGG